MFQINRYTFDHIEGALAHNSELKLYVFPADHYFLIYNKQMVFNNYNHKRNDFYVIVSRGESDDDD